MNNSMEITNPGTCCMWGRWKAFNLLGFTYGPGDHSDVDENKSKLWGKKRGAVDARPAVQLRIITLSASLN